MTDTEAGAGDTAIMTEAMMAVGAVIKVAVTTVAVIAERQSIPLKKARWRREKYLPGDSAATIQVRQRFAAACQSRLFL